MNRTRFFKCICALICVAFLLSSVSCSARGKNPESSSPEIPQQTEAEPENTAEPDFDNVTAGIGLTSPGELEVTRPYEDIVIDLESYYITGLSNPDMPLLLNGEEVKSRGEYGSFGVFAELENGANAFVFTQGDSEKTVTITRGTDDTIYTTDSISKMAPESDDAIRGGEVYTLRCVAPSGSSVTARIQGRTITLEQRAATAVDGIPATFTAEFIPENTAGTENAGQVAYTLEWNGEKSEYASGGSLFITGSGSPLLVRSKDVSATVFEEESVESDYVATLKHGAVDIVTDIGADMYRLSMGGWVVKSSLEPLTEPVETVNKISEAVPNIGDKVETLYLKCSAAAPYRSEREADRLSFTFIRTSGINEVALKNSSLFTDAQVSAQGDDMELVFLLNEKNPLWGYLVEYREDGILLTFRRAPEPSEKGGPLNGISIVLDAGHGGTDPGTLGIARESGAMEKDINLAAAKATRTYLEALGATVTMTRENDDTVDMNSRLEMFQHPEVDFIISMHCNSIPNNRDGTLPSGVEVYYYEKSASQLAEAVLRRVCEGTGRDDRGARQANYKITLNSNAPSVLVEMGFVTNPREYDNLCDKQAIYNTAAAIADGIIASIA